MEKKDLLRAEDKINACEDYLYGRKKVFEIVLNLGITRETFRRWILKYKVHGIQAFSCTRIPRTYSREFKLKVVQDYLNGQGSITDLMVKYNISAFSVVQKWIIKYNKKAHSVREHASSLREIKSNCFSLLRSPLDQPVSFQIAPITLSSQNHLPHDEERKKEHLSLYQEVIKLRQELQQEKIRNQNLEKIISVLKKNEEIRLSLVRDFPKSGKLRII